MDEIGRNVTASQLESMFIAADLDRNGLIDYDEFKALIYSLQSLDAQWANERLERSCTHYVPVCVPLCTV